MDRNEWDTSGWRDGWSTPTKMLPTPVAGQVAIILPEERALRERDAYQAEGEVSELRIYHQADMVAGYLKAMAGSGLSIDVVDKERMTFWLRLDRNSRIYIETGGYSQGNLELWQDDVVIEGQGCQAIGYEEMPLEVAVSCYAGRCGYQIGRWEKVEIEVGKQVRMVGEGGAMVVVGGMEDIPESEAREWAGRLPVGSTAYNCAIQYIPTPTPTRRPQPTNTPTSRAQPGTPAQASRTPSPVPSSTPRPPNTAAPTNAPHPTNTPRPTNTDAPENTPKPTKTERPTRTPKNNVYESGPIQDSRIDVSNHLIHYFLNILLSTR